MRSLKVVLSALVFAVLGLTAISTSSAFGTTPAPHWLVVSQPSPTYFHAGDTSDFYWIVAMNDGGAATSGKITLRDTLPVGVVVTPMSISASAGVEGNQYGEAKEMACGTTGVAPQTVECTTEVSVPIGDRLIAKITVEVPSTTTGLLENSVTVTGGGAPEAASTDNTTPVVTPSSPVPYGVSLAAQATEADGTLTTQAGAHPFAFSTIFAVNVGRVNPQEEGACVPPNTEGEHPGCPELVATPKDVEIQMPAGFVGNALAVPRCRQELFTGARNAGNVSCPASTQVGDIYVAFYGFGNAEQYAPVYNIEPPPGQPAELGFTVAGGAHIPLFFHVRSDGDYGITVGLTEISSVQAVRLASMMIWGVPAAAAHNPMRESAINGCEPGAKKGVLGCNSDAKPERPFLTMPSECSGQPLDVAVSTDSWQAPLNMVSGSPEAILPPLTGCEKLSLTSEINLALTTARAGAPSGYDFAIKVPQAEGAEEPATPDVRDIETTLPVGAQISPSAANGLVACTDEEFGRTTGTVGKCPPEAKVGSVTIRSPLLMEPVTGSVYVGEPECSPCTPVQVADGTMVRLFIEAKMPEPSPGVERPAVLVKLAGHTDVNAGTGQLTAVFTETPQLPFSEVELTLDDGPDAPITNPTKCGPAVAVAKLSPWSAEEQSSEVEATVATGPPSIEGCGAPSFTPNLTAGMYGSGRGGSFGSFAVDVVRPDGQRDVGAVTLHTPPGLAGMIAKVQLCGEAQANAGTCAASSQIGEVTASVGSGSQPYTIHGGKVFLTGPYGGGPFGLSIVVPAQAGPYRLAGVSGTGEEGDGSVVIRGSIKVNPKTAAITITTNPPPTQLDGIPLHLQKVIVNVNREGFMFNPTNCDAMHIESTITSSTGTAFGSNYPFQSTDCASLPFRPGFAVATKAHHTRKNGTYLHVSVTSGSGQANIKSVFVELPKILPSRTSTLNKACSEKQFAENPAGCPSASKVGTAIANTPVLPVPLTGPAIFVSHGGAGFPELDVVLQGDGVTVDLAGITNIKKGITSSDFSTVPDVPVSKFELTLPAGPYSALAATANLCSKTVAKHHHKVKEKRTLNMPTTIVGQNGAVIKQTTKIAVQGCGKR